MNPAKEMLVRFIKIAAGQASLAKGLCSELEKFCEDPLHKKQQFELDEIQDLIQKTSTDIDGMGEISGGFWVQASQSPPVDEKGKSKRFLVFSEDFSKQKHGAASPFQFAKYIPEKGGWFIEGESKPVAVTHYAHVYKPGE